MDPTNVEWMKGVPNQATYSDAYTPGQDGAIQPSGWFRGLPTRNSGKYSYPTIDFGGAGQVEPYHRTQDEPPQHRVPLTERTGRKLPRNIDYNGQMELDQPKTRLPHEPLFDSLNQYHEALLRMLGMGPEKAPQEAKRHPTQAYQDRMRDKALRMYLRPFPMEQAPITENLVPWDSVGPRNAPQTRQEAPQRPYRSEYWENYGRGQQDPQRAYKPRKLYNY